jgi:hypothetical protein
MAAPSFPPLQPPSSAGAGAGQGVSTQQYYGQGQAGHSTGYDGMGSGAGIGESSGSSASFRRPDGQFITYSGNSTIGQSNSLKDSFFTPTYLAGSRYAERLKADHDAKHAALQAALQAHQAMTRNRSASMSISISPTHNSLSNSAGSISYIHQAGAAKSHRGLSHDVIEHAPKSSSAEDPPAPLPSKWNPADKSPGLEIMGQGLEMRYTGANKNHDDAAVARADHPIPKMAGLYYFEITVLSKQKEGLLSVGFCEQKVQLTRLPGWEPGSWAYHGDDGQIFCANQHGKAYAPKYATGDTVGCGINFRTGTAFFTRNGVHLGKFFS